MFEFFIKCIKEDKGYIICVKKEVLYVIDGCVNVWVEDGIYVRDLFD